LGEEGRRGQRELKKWFGERLARKKSPKNPSKTFLEKERFLVYTYNITT
jgi:hypothetical protein